MKALLPLIILASTALSHAAPTVWISNFSSNSIRRFDADTGVGLGAVTGGSIGGPLGMTLGPDGLIYAASEATNTIGRYKQDGTFLDTFISTGTAAPTAIAFNKNKELFVANFNESSVSRYAPGGSYLGKFVLPGVGGMNGPDLGMAFGPDGHLYVPSFFGNAIQKYDGTTGAYLGDFVPGGGPLTQPRQILWRGGKVYVSSDNGNKVLTFDQTTGAYLGDFLTAGASGLSGASGMAFFGDRLYLTSWRTNKVLQFHGTTGAFEREFISTTLRGPVGLLVVPEPAGLALISAATVRCMIRKRRKTS